MTSCCNLVAQPVGTEEVCVVIQQVRPGVWRLGPFMQLLHEPALDFELNRIKWGTAQDKGSLGTREKNVLSEIAKPNGFYREQPAKLKAIQGSLQLLLRQHIQALRVPPCLHAVSFPRASNAGINASDPSGVITVYQTVRTRVQASTDSMRVWCMATFGQY